MASLPSYIAQTVMVACQNDNNEVYLAVVKSLTTEQNVLLMEVVALAESQNGTE